MLVVVVMLRVVFKSRSRNQPTSGEVQYFGHESVLEIATAMVWAASIGFCVRALGNALILNGTATAVECVRISDRTPVSATVLALRACGRTCVERKRNGAISRTA